MGNSRYTSNLQVRTNGWKYIVFGSVIFGVGAILGGVVGVLLFVRITGGTAVPSAPISAPTLSLGMVGTPASSISATTPTSVPTLGNVATSLIPTVALTTLPEVNAAAATAVTSQQLFRIVSAESQARFAVSETIPLGTAVGTTDQIAGDIIVDFIAPSNSRIGVIRINLRTLTTDDPDRDRSIRCCVLLTAQNAYEFTDFVPTAISGLPEQVSIGETISFQVTGDLTLRGVTRAVTFNVTLTLVSTSELRGLAGAIVNRSDFDILNDAQNMLDYHGVAEAVTLEFEFIARAVPQ